MKTRRAFTIVEVLVVVCVIAVLAGMLLPVFQTARDDALSVSCVSHLRQLGMAFSIYAQDYDETLPRSGDWRERSLAGWVWVPREFVVVPSAGALFSRVGHVALYGCGTVPFAYTVNNVLAGRALVEVPNAALLIEESERAFGGLGPNDGVFFFDHTVEDLLTKRHRGGGHVLWLDGHVKWLDATRRFSVTVFGGG